MAVGAEKRLRLVARDIVTRDERFKLIRYEQSVSPSHPLHHPPRERLRHAPLLVHTDREHQFLKSLTLELADLLDQRLGRADQAGGADEAGVDQLGFPRVQIRVVELVRAEMPMLRRRLLHERAVALPDRTQELR